MIAAAIALTAVLTERPCPSHPSLNRVEVHKNGKVEYGCGMQYKNLLIYVLDDGNEYVTEIKEQENKK